MNDSRGFGITDSPQSFSGITQPIDISAPTRWSHFPYTLSTERLRNALYLLVWRFIQLMSITFQGASPLFGRRDGHYDGKNSTRQAGPSRNGGKVKVVIPSADGETEMTVRRRASDVQPGDKVVGSETPSVSFGTKKHIKPAHAKQVRNRKRTKGTPPSKPKAKVDVGNGIRRKANKVKFEGLNLLA